LEFDEVLKQFFDIFQRRFNVREFMELVYGEYKDYENNEKQYRYYGGDN
jgi:hypothetical protein